MALSKLLENNKDFKLYCKADDIPYKVLLEHLKNKGYDNIPYPVDFKQLYLIYAFDLLSKAKQAHITTSEEFIDHLLEEQSRTPDNKEQLVESMSKDLRQAFQKKYSFFVQPWTFSTKGGNDALLKSKIEDVPSPEGVTGFGSLSMLRGQITV